MITHTQPGITTTDRKILRLALKILQPEGSAKSLITNAPCDAFRCTTPGSAQTCSPRGKSWLGVLRVRVLREVEPLDLPDGRRGGEERLVRVAQSQVPLPAPELVGEPALVEGRGNLQEGGVGCSGGSRGRRDGALPPRMPLLVACVAAGKERGVYARKINTTHLSPPLLSMDGQPTLPYIRVGSLIFVPPAWQRGFPSGKERGDWVGTSHWEGEDQMKGWRNRRMGRTLAMGKPYMNCFPAFCAAGKQRRV